MSETLCVNYRSVTYHALSQARPNVRPGSEAGNARRTTGARPRAFVRETHASEGEVDVFRRLRRRPEGRTVPLVSEVLSEYATRSLAAMRSALDAGDNDGAELHEAEMNNALDNMLAIRQALA